MNVCIEIADAHLHFCVPCTGCPAAKLSVYVHRPVSTAKRDMRACSRPLDLWAKQQATWDSIEAQLSSMTRRSPDELAMSDARGAAAPHNAVLAEQKPGYACLLDSQTWQACKLADGLALLLQIAAPRHAPMHGGRGCVEHLVEHEPLLANMYNLPVNTLHIQPW